MKLGVLKGLKYIRNGIIYEVLFCSYNYCHLRSSRISMVVPRPSISPRANKGNSANDLNLLAVHQDKLCILVKF
jgi:hypothetical protein